MAVILERRRAYGCPVHELPLDEQWHSFAKAELSTPLDERNQFVATELALGASPTSLRSH
jgi:hypothetical protein